MSFDDDAAETYGLRPPPHPDDRLWRHPSEMAAGGSAHRPARPVPNRSRGLHWGAIATLGTASVVLAAGAALLVGVRTPDVSSSLDQAGVTGGLVPESTATTSTLVTPSSETFLGLDAVRRLGIEVSEPDDGGVAIAAVDPDGPAADTGIATDDVIVDVDGTAITDLDTLTSALADHDLGDVVEVTVDPADGTDDAITVEITVGALTDATSSSGN